MASRRAGKRKRATRRAPAARAVGRHERGLQRLVSSVDEILYAIRFRKDAAPRVTFVSDSVTAILGHRPQEFLRDAGLWASLLHPDDAATAMEAQRRLRERPEGFVRLYRLRHKQTGEWRWMEDKAALHLDRSGRLIGFFGAARDVTERMQVEEALRARARQQAAVAKLGQDALEGLDLDALMARAVAAMADTLEVEYAKVLELLPGDTALRLRAGVGWKEGCVGHATVPTGTDSQAGYTLQAREAVVVEDLRTEQRFRGPPLLVEHGVISGLSVIMGQRDRPFGILGAHTARQRTFSAHDVNFVQAVANVLAAAVERLRAAAAERESRAQLRALSKELLDTMETERRRLARGLHDDIGQLLTAVRLNIQTAQRTTGAETAAGLLDESLAVIDKGIEAVRSLALDLRPTLLDDLGLAAALRWYLNRHATRAGLTAGLVTDGLKCRLPADVETACFRVAQEAVTNVVRHASAGKVEVEVRCQDGWADLFIRDDGVGFDVAERARRTESVGLLGMRERVLLLGGEITINSGPERGTTVWARIPVPKGTV